MRPILFLVPFFLFASRSFSQGPDDMNDYRFNSSTWGQRGMHSISNGGFPNWVTRLHVTTEAMDKGKNEAR